VKLQPVDDLDRLALGAHREPSRWSSVRITALTTPQLAAPMTRTQPLRILLSK
jgi:hypothetical protein